MPAIFIMIGVLYNQYKKGNRVATLTLLIATVLIWVRFSILAFTYDGMEMTDTLRFLESFSSMYILPATYAFLCDQCGTRWNNMSSRIMAALPFITLFSYPVIDLGTGQSGHVHTDIVPHALNIYWGGKRLLYVYMRELVVIADCIIIAFRMLVLWFRIRAYGLKFTGAMLIYYVWVFLMLGFTIYSFAHFMSFTTSGSEKWDFFVFYNMMISVGYILVPYSFTVRPIVTQQGQPVRLDNFLEQNIHLVELLHRLFEEEKIYLQHTLRIDDLASKMGTNRTYVTRLMRMEYGMSFTDYVTSRRVEHSKHLLLTTTQTLEEVAEASGFSSASSYSRVFKRLTNDSPIAWRELRRGANA